ncbi:hypothetical protein PABG_05895 [Paracoccidioides brasiliensis Pb03]|nr:hypothetical protein PABG_05895 [Paracoccidioides brasiliensis Pb03]
MKILDRQSAILTNVEVLAHFRLNPPRKPPNPPPNSRNFIPKPDLRDHNTVVKEFHDYVTRLSPHLLKYPSFTAPNASIESDDTSACGTDATQTQSTDLDIALREVIHQLRPFQLTKAEVLMIVNLGIGLDSVAGGEEGGEDGGGGGGEGAGESMEVDGAEGGEVEGGEEGIDEEADYGALALLDTVIEDREERLSTEDVREILRVVRETLGKGRRRGSSVAGGGG